MALLMSLLLQKHFLALSRAFQPGHQIFPACLSLRHALLQKGQGGSKRGRKKLFLAEVLESQGQEVGKIGQGSSVN